MVCGLTILHLFVLQTQEMFAPVVVYVLIVMLRLEIVFMPVQIYMQVVKCVQVVVYVLDVDFFVGDMEDIQEVGQMEMEQPCMFAVG